jgi:hypothetical protein
METPLQRLLSGVNIETEPRINISKKKEGAWFLRRGKQDGRVEFSAHNTFDAAAMLRWMGV